MADREQIAATLAASLLKPIAFGTGSVQTLDVVEGQAAFHAVAIYRAVLAELAKQQHEGDQRRGGPV